MRLLSARWRAGDLAWVVAALVMSGRGLDLSDEGFYLLSYGGWDENSRAFSGVQYLYGPWFELFGYDVPALRVLRLVTVLGATWPSVSPRPGGSVPRSATT